jgi:hypothetical protein
MCQIDYFVLVILISFCAPGLPAALAGSPPSPPGNTLLLSDLHFDPLADPSLFKRLRKTTRTQRLIFEPRVFMNLLIRP